MPVAVIYTILASLVVSLTFIPFLASRCCGRNGPVTSTPSCGRLTGRSTGLRLAGCTGPLARRDPLAMAAVLLAGAWP